MTNRLLLLLLLAFLVSCQPASKEAPELSLDDQAFYSSYINTYSTGLKSKNTVIEIGLTSPNEQVNLDEEADQSLLTIEPKTAGKVVWRNNQKLAFQPASSLESDQQYLVTVDLKKIFPEIDNNKSAFQFNFKTKSMILHSSAPSVHAYDSKDPSKQHIEGSIRSSDDLTLELVQQCVSAVQDERTLNLTWTNGSNPNEFNYTILDVQRNDAASRVEIHIDGRPIDSNTERALDVAIPALNVFEVMTVALNQGTDQQVDILFTDHLDEDQNLTGLVRLANGGKLRTSISDNRLSIFPANRQEGDEEILISKSITNVFGTKLKEDIRHSVSFKKLTPQLQALASGVIMPSSDQGLVFPFKAVSLHAVQVRVIQIFEDNIGQFLQANNLNETNQLRRVGRLVHKSNISLGDHGDKALQSWNDYAVDLSTLINTEPGALYRVKISFGKNHAIYACGDNAVPEVPVINPNTDPEFLTNDYVSGYYDDDEYYESYWLEDQDDPCADEYYNSGNPNSRPIFQNVMASDIGLIAKKSSNDKLLVIASNLKTTTPLSGVELTLFNLQNRKIQSSTTDQNGFAEFELKTTPFYVLAASGNQKGYLKLDDGASLSLSTFDVSGGKTQNGLKGFLYQERGVSRPGDSLYVTFILDDRSNPLPDDHPVVFELYDPRSQLSERKVVNTGINNFYTFRTATTPDAPTGNWLVKAMLGGSSFSKSIKIETVKPNRLKINLDFEGDIIIADQEKQGLLDVKWLHGADAKNLKADVEMSLQSMTTTFSGFEGFSFDDVSKDFESEAKKIFDGRLNESGQANITPEIWVQDEAPGMLNAAFKIRAFEEGGNFSVDRFSKKVSPFDTYVGVKVPEGKGWNGAIFSDQATPFEIITLDANGRPVSTPDLKVEIFNLRWNWWWERSSRSNIRNYVADRGENLLQSRIVSTNAQGKATFNFNLETERWGRTLVRITDPKSGHSTSRIFYTTYSRWWDEGSDDIPGGAEMLSFKLDKSDYQVGENINVDMPNSKTGKALISIENGTEVLQKFWLDIEASEGKVTIPASSEMAPNAYVHITYIQPHGQVENDRPIRLYGVQRVNVTDPKTRLTPMLTAPTEIRPESDYELTIKEQNGQLMTYTIAVVDDGILDLTRFQTPDPWKTFYARQALGVKTWDLYSDVMGAYGGTLTQLLALGGDEFAEGKEPQKANRFKPVVRFEGPFQLAKGRSAKHILKMPNYVGSVRAMVVAGNPEEGAYGHTEATIPVKKPLMVAATLPRVLSPTESLDVPITIFAMDKKIKEVQVTVESNDLLQFARTSETIHFSDIGDQVVRLPLNVADAIGIGRLKVTVSSAGETATEEIELDIRNPNPQITRVQESIIQANTSSDLNYSFFGVEGTNEAVLELSTIPPLNLEKRLKYLIRFPHGCVEQTTSAAFPQLYLADLADLSNNQKDNAQSNVQNAIQKLKRFQNSAGGFAYWPGSRSSSDWGSSYAGHFLLEAKNKGYVIPYGMIDQWMNYQSTTARNWSDREDQYWSYRSNRLAQAYRLYTLALAGKPELGAMNRLRGLDELPNIVKWKLAGAYALAGKKEVARELLKDASSDIKPYAEMSYTYGSHTRDKALILQTLTLLDDRSQALKLIRNMSADIGSNQWMSTQTTAMSLMAISKFLIGQDKDAPVDVGLDLGNGNKTDFQMTKSIKLIELSGDGKDGQVSVSNKGGKELYARLVLSGTPRAGEEENTASNLSLKVIYTDLEGNKLSLDNIAQGTDINAEVTVGHTGPGYDNYSELALSQIFPAGWEIRNTRMDESDAVGAGDRFDYQDVRDDRVMTYFSLPRQTFKTFRVQVNAAYSGRYYLPAVQCEAMYDNTISASRKGQWINVVQ